MSKSQQHKLYKNESRHKGFMLHLNEVVNKRYERLSGLLDDGSFSEVIKHAGRFAGRRPSIHIETGLLERVNKAGFSHLIEQFDPKEVKESFDTQLLEAEKLMTEKVKFNGNINLLAQATERVSLSCKFPNSKFTPVSYRFAADNQINKSSSSGYPLFQRKGIVLDKLVEQAESLTPDSSMWLWPQTRGFRLQLRTSEQKVKLKTRIMYPYPGVFILLEDTFIIPFVDHFIKNDTFYVIGRNGAQLSALLRRKLSPSKRILMADITRFDQDLLNECIIMAFSVIRSQLKLSQHEALLFEQMVAYCCTALMVSKSPSQPAYGFIKYKGMPSGSGFTNMVDTLAHAIMLEYIFPGITTDCLLCGDDNITDFRNKSLSVLKQQFKEVFNLTITDSKTKLSNTWTNIEFLGFRWKSGVRLVNTRLVINQLLWHADFRVDLDYYERHIARSASVLLNGANGKFIFSKLFPDLILLLKQGLDLRFTYLMNTQPPTRIPGVISYSKLKGPTPGSSNESLKLHLDKGWLIR